MTPLPERLEDGRWTVWRRHCTAPTQRRLAGTAMSSALRVVPRFACRRLAGVRPVFQPISPTDARLPRRRLAASAAGAQPRLRLGSEAPDFTAQTTHGKMDFHRFVGDSWAILFSHPADFTPVCTTELGAFARLKPEFDRRGVKMVGLVRRPSGLQRPSRKPLQADRGSRQSANDLSSHAAWVDDINAVCDTNVSFPIIADADRRVAFLYDMVTQDDVDRAAAAEPNAAPMAFTIRSVFVIDPAKKIRLVMLYPASTGRNSAEVLRVVDALQAGDRKGIATPIDWSAGDDVIVPPTVTTEDARKKFGHVREVRPYLRYVKGHGAR